MYDVKKKNFFFFYSVAIKLILMDFRFIYAFYFLIASLFVYISNLYYGFLDVNECLCMCVYTCVHVCACVMHTCMCVTTILFHQREQNFQGLYLAHQGWFKPTNFRVVGKKGIYFSY